MGPDMRKDNILQRLKRIEGQVRGIQRMIGEEQSCVDILMQIAAVRAALTKWGWRSLKATAASASNKR